MSTTHAPAPPQAGPGLPTTRTQQLLLIGLRVGIAFLWIENIGWKRPPDFGSLRSFTEDAVNRPVFGPWAWLVEHLVLPNFTAFAWLTLFVEASLGIFLLVGLATRFWAVIGLAQVVAITLSALNSPGEWEWSYYLMFLAHVAILATAPGRVFGLDGLLRPRWLASDGRLATLLVRAS